MISKFFLMTLMSAIIALSAIPATVQAQTPFRVTVSVDTNGVGSWTVGGVNNGVFAAAKLQTLLSTGGVGSTDTVSYVVGTSTNTAGSLVLAAGAKALSLTNTPWLFTGDKVNIATGVPTDTNGVATVTKARNIYLIGLEQ